VQSYNDTILGNFHKARPARMSADRVADRHKSHTVPVIVKYETSVPDVNVCLSKLSEGKQMLLGDHAGFEIAAVIIFRSNTSSRSVVFRDL
jgi:hypothetical protein